MVEAQLSYPEEIEHKDIAFKFDGELGAGAFGKVYRYKSTKS